VTGVQTCALPISTPANDNKVVSAADFKNSTFNLMNFTGKWEQLIGNPSSPFKAMIWGTGGSGKSTLAIEFARYLAGKLNKRVLYVANEEGAGATLHEKMTRLNAFHPNLFITKTLPPRLVEYDFVFCDSANSMQMDLPKFEQTAKVYPRLSWVLLFQTTKEGKFLGEKPWQHAVDVEIYCENGKAKALKSRFGGKDTVDAF
jgi:predicted ATP-dependent serine protease